MFRKAKSFFETVFQALPPELGGFFWDLHINSLYLISGAREKNLSVENLEFSYAELGQKSKPCLIIIHGFSDSKEGFLSLANYLAQDFYVIIPDLPGFGKSSKPNLKYSLELYSNWLDLFLTKLGIFDFHALGNSMGGAILLEYNYLFPSKINSIVLSCSAGLILEEIKGSFYDEYQSGKNLFLIQEEHDFEYFISKIFYKKEILPPPVKSFVFEKYKQNGSWYSKLMSDILEPFLNTESKYFLDLQKHKLESVNCPTLILWGEYDGVFPKEIAYEFQKAISHSELKIIEEVGHLPHMEKPQEVYKSLLRFYKDHLLHHSYKK